MAQFVLVGEHWINLDQVLSVLDQGSSTDPVDFMNIRFVNDPKESLPISDPDEVRALRAALSSSSGKKSKRPKAE